MKFTFHAPSWCAPFLRGCCCQLEGDDVPHVPSSTSPKDDNEVISRSVVATTTSHSEVRDPASAAALDEPPLANSCVQDFVQGMEDKIPYFSFAGLEVDAKIVSVYDGDTFTAVFPYRGQLIKYRVRGYGYDTPEMKPPRNQENREAEKAAAVTARQHFLDLCGKSPDGLVQLHLKEFDKYGRLLAVLYNKVDSTSINDMMIASGHAVAYDGGTKLKYTSSS